MKLNSVTQPTIIKVVLKRLSIEGFNLGRSSNKSKMKLRWVVCVNIPLLFEGGMPIQVLFGTVILVACSPTLQ